MIAVGDAARREALRAALVLHPLKLSVEAFADGQALIERAGQTLPALLILDQQIDDAAGTAVLDKIRAAAGALPRSVILFDEAHDAGRTLVADYGVIDFVLSTSVGTDAPLMALVGRLISREVLETRLDATTVQFRALVEHSSDGIYILQKGDEIVYANPQFGELCGYTPDELVGAEFNIFDEIIAEESRPILEDRLRRVRAGETVPPRYDFVARHRDGHVFDAQVSVSYITFRGEPASLGIMQDITERKRHELAITRKNRELALQSDLAASINEAVELEELLKVGTRRLHSLLDAGATGLSLLTPDGSALVLKASEGLTPQVQALLSRVSISTPTLLGEAVRTREVQIVADLAADKRVAFAAVKDLGFEGAMVVPVNAQNRTLGVAFIFTEKNRPPSLADRDLMIAIGNLLGTAIQKASLLDQERAAVRNLTALDEIALAVASRLDAVEIAETVGRSVQRIFGPRRVVIARLSKSRDALWPLCVLDHEDKVGSDQVFPLEDSLLGEALEKRAVIMRTKTDDEGSVYPYTKEMFDQGIAAAVAVPVQSEGELGGGLLLGFENADDLDAAALAALGSLAPHVAVALKNADLFEARKQALDDLRAAQNKLVQSEKLRALGELAAGVAHDFNNVLGAILGRAQLLKTKLRDPGLLKHAEIIEKAANDGAETVRRIQEIGRQETTDDFITVNLSDIVRDVVDLTVSRWRYRPLEEGRPIELVQDMKAPDVCVAGNPHELREVLINLVHNAVDAMPAGGTLTLTVARSEAGAGCGLVSVRDSGIGMPEKVRERIFDPFFTTKGDQGTGLGLSVSYSIIQRHGGEIEVSSRCEGDRPGTVFVVVLPETEPTVDETLPADLSAAAAVLSGEGDAFLTDDKEATFEDKGSTRILVIDDEENIRDILTDILETGGYQVISAADGDAGLALLATTRVDLVFTDLGLPGMSGYEVAALIRKRFPRLPVGLVTGWGATLNLAEVEKHGIDLILSKPFKFEQVLGLVQEAMATRT